MQLGQNTRKDSGLIHSPIQNPDLGALPLFICRSDGRRPTAGELDALAILVCSKCLTGHNDKPTDTNDLRGGK